jgi:NADPH2:quinone reductase
MKAFYLVKNGSSSEAFELRELPVLKPSEKQVLIEVEAFGLNFADVMARLGYYKACPPLPTVIGYDVVGKILEKGSEVTNLEIGQRVIALTRFGGYATHSLADYRGVVPIKEDTDFSEATALATQFGTAYYASEISMQLHEKEHVLIHAAAGGVGTALVQLAKRRKCIIYGTAGSDEKIEYLRNIGVDFPINYNNQDFELEILKIRGQEKIDAIFDSIGGKYIKKDLNILAVGGRLAMYGAAQIAGASDKKSIFRQLKTLFGFGKYRPTQFFAKSQSIIGINMLKIGDYKPYILQKCLNDVVDLYNNNEIKPHISKIFSANQLTEAHDYLQKRKSIGKVVVKW